MVIVKNSKLSASEIREIKSFFSEVFDPYCDFYLTKNNIRLFIRDNPEIFFEGLNRGDYIAYNENGIVSLIGFSDKAARKYLKFLTVKPGDVVELLVALSFKYSGEIYCKIKKNNPAMKTLLGMGFQIIGNRGQEELLKRG
jgi:hypothetical protein